VVKARLFDKRKQLVEIFIGLAGETEDKGLAQANTRQPLPEPG